MKIEHDTEVVITVTLSYQEASDLHHAATMYRQLLKNGDAGSGTSIEERIELLDQLKRGLADKLGFTTGESDERLAVEGWTQEGAGVWRHRDGRSLPPLPPLSKR